jgi:hypothetical protein
MNVSGAEAEAIRTIVLNFTHFLQILTESFSFNYLIYVIAKKSSGSGTGSTQPREYN